MTNCLRQFALNKVLYVIVASQLVACGGSGGGGGSSASSASTGSSATGTSTGTITLEWTAPVIRADGTPLSLAEIDSFRIYYREQVDDYYPNNVDVKDGTATSATMTGIPAGNYFLAMTTFDTEGRQSKFSSEVSKTVQ